jgi:hypothetical protein
LKSNREEIDELSLLKDIKIGPAGQTIAMKSIKSLATAYKNAKVQSSLAAKPLTSPKYGSMKISTASNTFTPESNPNLSS